MWIILNDLTLYQVIAVKTKISCALWFSIIMSVNVLVSSISCSIFLLLLKNRFKIILLNFKTFKAIFIKCLLSSLIVSFIYVSFSYCFSSDDNWWDGGNNNWNLPSDYDLFNKLYIKTDLETFINLYSQEILGTNPRYFQNLESLSIEEIETIYSNILTQRYENSLNLQNNLRVFIINEEMEANPTLYITTGDIFNSFLKNFLKNLLFSSFFTSLFLFPFINYVGVV